MERRWRVAALQHLEQFEHGMRGGKEQADREDHQLEAEGANIFQWERGRFAAFGPVEEQGNVRKGFADGAQFFERAGSLDENHVCSGFAVGASTSQRVLKAIDGVGIGAGDDDEIGVLPRLYGGAHLLYHLLHWNDLFSLHVSALLGPYLILDVQPGHACVFVFANGAPHVDGIAIARIGIRDQWNISYDGSQRGGPVDHFAHGEQANIRLTEYAGCGAETGHIDDGEACLSNQTGAEAIICAGDNK